MSSELIWFVVGLGLVLAEFVIPGLLVVFFGFGAFLTSLLTALGVTKTLELQLIVFIVSSVVSLLLLRATLKKVFMGRLMGQQDVENFAIEVGKIVPVVELIEPDEVGGRVRYQGTLWKARSSERLTPGESVRIVGLDNLTLIVEKNKKEG